MFVFSLSLSFSELNRKKSQRMVSVESIRTSSGNDGLPKPRVATPIPLSKSMDLLPVIENKRKFSFPVALHSSSLLSESSTLSARRRFSNVSDVVTRKLSSTIGWKLPVVVPTQDLVTQGKCLCGQYIRNRLKRSGLFTKKLGLQRLRSIVGTPSALVVREVFPALNHVSLHIFEICLLEPNRLVKKWRLQLESILSISTN